jgi:hypothetical protein
MAVGLGGSELQLVLGVSNAAARDRTLAAAVLKRPECAAATEACDLCWGVCCELKGELDWLAVASKVLLAA